MGFVKSQEELDRIRAILARPRALRGEMVSMEFRTTTETVAGLLPPGLEPTDEPKGTVYLGRWEASNAGPFAGGGIYLNARHGSFEGHYCVMMPVTTESAALFGRDLMGEPKKCADVEIGHEGSRATATVSRLGVEIISVSVERARTLPAAVLRASSFHYKYVLRVDGQGLEADPQLVAVDTEFDLDHMEVGSASLSLASSPLDPLAEIKLVEAGLGSYTRGHLRAKPRVLGTVPAADFLPYAFAKTDDWNLLDNE